MIVIIALGESIVAIGVGAEHGVDAGVVVAAALGIALTGALWWAYFDVVSTFAAHRLAEATVGREQNEMARDGYSYLHLPIVAGVVLVALGLKTTLAHVDEPLDAVAPTALLGGVVLYLLGVVALKWRTLQRLSVPRLVGAAVLTAGLPLAREVDAVAAVGIAVIVLWSSDRAEITLNAQDREARPPRAGPGTSDWCTNRRHLHGRPHRPHDRRQLGDRAHHHDRAGEAGLSLDRLGQIRCQGRDRPSGRRQRRCRRRDRAPRRRRRRAVRGRARRSAPLRTGQQRYSLTGAVEDVSDDEAWSLFETMVRAPMRLSRLALPAMRAGGGGRIVNVSSITGRVSSPFAGHYTAAKHALEALSDALRMEVAGGVQVILVEPGGFKTGIWAEVERDIDKRKAAGSRYVAAYRRSLQGQRLIAPIMGDPEGARR